MAIARVSETMYQNPKETLPSHEIAVLFLAVGFVFVAIGAAVAGLLFEYLHYELTAVATIEAGAEVIGFFLIVYSIVRSRD